MYIEAPRAQQILQDHYNEIISITFTKRTDGSDRVLNGRLGVSKYVTGVGMSYDPQAYNLFVIYDLQNEGYRCVSIEGIKSIRAGGNTYTP